MKAILRQKSPLLALVGWCCILLAVRFWYSGSATRGYLLWNLFLACVPLIAAVALRLVAPRPDLAIVKVAIFCVWLAFLPNAPYLVTDLKHLTFYPPIPLWFDVALFASFAATGVMLAYASVADIEVVTGSLFGRKVGRAVAIGSLLLCGLGVYVGRFLRWNSWDILTSPWSIARQAAHHVIHPISHTLTWQVSAIYGLGLAIGYVVLRSTASIWGEELSRAAQQRYRAELH